MKWPARSETSESRLQRVHEEQLGGGGGSSSSSSSWAALHPSPACCPPTLPPSPNSFRLLAPWLPCPTGGSTLSLFSSPSLALSLSPQPKVATTPIHLVNQTCRRRARQIASSIINFAVCTLHPSSTPRAVVLPRTDGVCVCHGEQERGQGAPNRAFCNTCCNFAHSRSFSANCMVGIRLSADG